MRDAHLWKKTRDEEDAEDDLYTYEEPPVEVQLDSGSGVLKKQRVSYDDEDDEALGNLKFTLQKDDQKLHITFIFQFLRQNEGVNLKLIMILSMI